MLPHHTDDLIESAISNGIETQIHRYEVGHTRVMYDYPEEFADLLIEFFSNELNK